MRVLFVYPLPPPGPEIYPGFHHGIGYLSAVLKEHGHSTSLFCTSRCNPGEVNAVLEEFQPQVVAVTSTSAEFPLACRLVRRILRRGPVPLFFGGVHATVAPEEVMSVEGVQGLCRGEGEEGFAQVADGLEKGKRKTDVPGFWFRDGARWIKNPPGDPASLEALPFPDRDIFGYADWNRPFRKIIGAEFLAGRGCPFRCSYCCTPLYSQLYQSGSYWRRRSVEGLLTEVRDVVNRYPVEVVGFHDDIFTLDNPWLEAFCNRYPVEVGKPFWCNTRVGCVTESQAKMLRKAGCFRVHLAVETGNPWLRKEILNRSITDEEILETFAFLKKAGMKRLAFNMLGLPYETETSILQTIELNRKIRPDRVHVTLFQPYPGTELNTFCWDKGLLKPGPVSSYYSQCERIENPDLPRETLFRYLRDFVPLVYGR